MGLIEDDVLFGGLLNRDSRDVVNDFTEMYCHVIRTVARLTSGLDGESSAESRLDAAVLLEKFLTANQRRVEVLNLPETLSRDLHLEGGVDEARALLILPRFRHDRLSLRRVSWASFVYLRGVMKHTASSQVANVLAEEDELLEI
jgi:hypothetical protein